MEFVLQDDTVKGRFQSLHTKNHRIDHNVEDLEYMKLFNQKYVGTLA